MRDIDREIGIRPIGGAPRDDAGQEENRRMGELLLRVDELEETLDTLRSTPEVFPLLPGEEREEILRTLERRTQAERARAEALQHGERVDYDAIERAMRLADAAG